MASKATVAHRELWSVVAWTLSHEGKRQDCPAAESVPGLGGGGHKPLRSLSAKGEPPRMVCAPSQGDLGGMLPSATRIKYLGSADPHAKGTGLRTGESEDTSLSFRIRGVFL